MSDDLKPPKRRVRYRGTHPRAFHEKYKELNAELYVGDVEKVRERGQTPAGTHRPICVHEILSILKPFPGALGLDATMGYGGHAEHILRALAPAGKLYGIDVDPIELPKTEARLRLCGFDEQQLVVRRMNFAGIPQLVAQTGTLFDFALADLGVSSMQIDTPSRGFSYKIDGPLDLRLNPHRGVPASSYISSLDEQALAELLRENADEPNARIIARAIVAAKGTVTSTTDLAQVVRSTVQMKHRATTDSEIKKAQQRVFQALRIAVNDEFGVLKQFLNLIPGCLKPGGRLAILTFHSGEDRLVKRSFKDGLRSGVYEAVARDVIRAGADERRSNPRSSSAKVRWAVRSQ